MFRCVLIGLVSGNLMLTASSFGWSQETRSDAPALSTPSPTIQTGQNPASPFLLEPEIEIKGDRIKRETYRSQPAGQNQNWNLDIGRFQPKIDDDPNDLIEDDKQGYSGMRLRLPLRGGLRQ